MCLNYEHTKLDFDLASPSQLIARGAAQYKVERNRLLLTLIFSIRFKYSILFTIAIWERFKQVTHKEECHKQILPIFNISDPLEILWKVIKIDGFCIHKYGMVFYLCQFWWWLDLGLAQEAQKGSRKGICPQFLTSWPSGLDLNETQNIWTSQLHDSKIRCFKFCDWRRLKLSKNEPNSNFYNRQTKWTWREEKR